MHTNCTVTIDFWEALYIIKIDCKPTSITGTREREAGEVTPIKAEHSRSYADDDKNYGAQLAIDMNFWLRSVTRRDPDGAIWLKLTLDQIRCVKEVLRFWRGGDPYQTWTCSGNGCNDCFSSSGDCSYYALTVSTEGASEESDLPSFPDCKYGNTVKFDRVKGGDKMFVAEIAVIETQGKI